MWLRVILTISGCWPRSLPSLRHKVSISSSCSQWAWTTCHLKLDWIRKKVIDEPHNGSSLVIVQRSLINRGHVTHFGWMWEQNCEITHTYWVWYTSSKVDRWTTGLICRLLVFFSLFDSVGTFGWSDCGVEMGKASLLCTSCADSGGICVAPFVTGFCECWTGEEMDCMRGVSTETHEEDLRWVAGSLLFRTSVAGVICGFWLYSWSKREPNITPEIGGFIIPGKHKNKTFTWKFFKK